MPHIHSFLLNFNSTTVSHTALHLMHSHTKKQASIISLLTLTIWGKGVGIFLYPYFLFPALGRSRMVVQEPDWLHPGFAADPWGGGDPFRGQADVDECTVLRDLGTWCPTGDLCWDGLLLGVISSLFPLVIWGLPAGGSSITGIPLPSAGVGMWLSLECESCKSTPYPCE